jgi:hypothetical protein
VENPEVPFQRLLRLIQSDYKSLARLRQSGKELILTLSLSTATDAGDASPADAILRESRKRLLEVAETVTNSQALK